ncbi:MAG: HPr family phosphocarrier protein [Bacillota bacterium]|nr:HPr family phosphocarrier protein [Candidatus Fermentithermobacillaceae bacterium]
MVEQTVVVQSEVGLHARPAALFVQTAAKFKSQITLEANGKTANGKSILQVLSLGAKQGDSLLIRAEGEDEAEALESLVDLIMRGAEDPEYIGG